MTVRLVGLLLVVAIAGTSVSTKGDDGKDRPYRDTIFGDYVFRVYQEISKNKTSPLVLSETLAVIRNGEELYVSDEDFRIQVNTSNLKNNYQRNSTFPDIELGADITGNGEPNVIVGTYSGGAHCCYGYMIFEAGKHFRLIDEIYSGDYPIGLLELDGTPGLEIIKNDGKFAYWKAPFASSPAPRVILKFDGSEYRINTALMRAPPMSEAIMKETAISVGQRANWDRSKMYPLNSDLWGVMLDLIYSGNADQAHDFLDMAWPSERGDKEEFAREFFGCILRESHYWPEIAVMNGLKPSKPVGNCLPEGG